MALQSSGAISLNNVNVELGISGTATITMNDTAVRALAGIASGAIAMSDFYGKSFAVNIEIWFNSIESYNGFEGSNNRVASAFADSSSYAHTISHTSKESELWDTNNFIYTAERVMWRNGYYTVNAWKATPALHVPPANSISSPFLPSEYWSYRIGPYNTTEETGYGNNPNAAAVHYHPTFTAASSYSLGNTFTVEFFFKPNPTYLSRLQYIQDTGENGLPGICGGGYMLTSVQTNLGQGGSNDGLIICIRGSTIHVRRGYTRINAGSVEPLTYNSTSVINSGPIVFGQQWYHVCFQANATSTALYVNGARVGTGSANTFSWTHLIPWGGPGGNVSHFRIVNSANVYTEGTNSRITVPTTPPGVSVGVGSVSIMTANGPQVKNEVASPVFAGGGGAVPVVDSPFTTKTAYNSTTHSGSAYFTQTTGALCRAVSPMALMSSYSLDPLGWIFYNGASNAATPLTVETWIKIPSKDTMGDFTPIMCVTHNSSFTLFMWMHKSGRVCFGVTDSIGRKDLLQWDSGKSIIPNPYQWNHVAVVFNLSGGVRQAYLFINGVVCTDSLGNPQIAGSTPYSLYGTGLGSGYGRAKVYIGAFPRITGQGSGAELSYDAWKTGSTPTNGIPFTDGTTSAANASYYNFGGAYYISNFRISKSVRYAVTGNFTPPTSPFTSDSNTLFLMRGENPNGGIRDSAAPSTGGASTSYSALTTSQAKTGSSSLQLENPANGYYYTANSPTNGENSASDGDGYYPASFYAAGDSEALTSLNPNITPEFSSVFYRRSQGGFFTGAVWPSSVTNQSLYRHSGGSTFECNFRIPYSAWSVYGPSNGQKRMLSLGAISIIISQGSGTNYRIDPSNPDFVFGTTNPSAIIYPNTLDRECASDAWHHLAIVMWGTSGGRVYLNGKLIAKFYYANTLGDAPMTMGTYNIGSSRPYEKGNSVSNMSGSFVGFIDNVKVTGIPKYFADTGAPFTPPTTTLLNIPTSNTYANAYDVNKYCVGGDTFDVNGYRYHVFTESGKLYNIGNSNITNAQILCVGGGGGGGWHYVGGFGGGGGGAGGAIVGSSITLVVNTTNTYYEINIGAGGAGGGRGSDGSDGGISYVRLINGFAGNWVIAAGGGGGGAGAATFPSAGRNGRNGITPGDGGQSWNVQGCGGGGSSSTYGNGIGGTGFTNGGAATLISSGSWGQLGGGGGGGGAGGPGGNSTNNGNFSEVVRGGNPGNPTVGGELAMGMTYGYGGQGGGATYVDVTTTPLGTNGNQPSAGCYFNFGDPYAGDNSQSYPPLTAYGSGGGGGGGNDGPSSSGSNGLIIIRYAL